MTNVVQPKVFCSRCLGFEACRWNGACVNDTFVHLLDPHVAFVTTCPEKEIGLGVPRDPVRVTANDDDCRLQQLNTEQDVTEKMTRFCRDYLDSLEEIDGFILKDRSPSCGLKDVKVYKNLEKGSPIRKGDGFFGGTVQTYFPYAAVETEGRLKNFSIREHFLTKLFALARFRAVREKASVRALMQFHAENKFLLMAYNQQEMREMGRIAANDAKAPAKQVLDQYREHLHAALYKPATIASNINVLMHAFGYFSDELGSKEKRFFLNTLEEYRREQIPLSVPLNLVQAYTSRFECEYLDQQTFFQPYPQELTTISDSGKGRDLT